MATGGAAQQQNVEYGLKVEIQDLKRALNDSLTLLRGNDEAVRALAEQLNLLATQQTRVASTARTSNREMTQAAQATRGLSEASRSAHVNLKNLAFQLGALVGVFGLADVLRRVSVGIYENARAYDTIRAKISLVTSDAREQADVLDYVRGTANRLGVEQRSLIDSYVRLRIASRGSVVEGKATQAVFEGLTTASAALRLSTDETRRAMKAFEQIISKGKLSAEEIRQQLGDVLPGALQVFQEASGKSAKEFDKLLAGGKLFLSEGMFEKIAAILQRDYSKGVKLDTIAAQVSLLKNAYDDLFQTLNLGGGRELISGALGAITEQVRSLNKTITMSAPNGLEMARALTAIGVAGGGLLAMNLFVRIATSLIFMNAAMLASAGAAGTAVSIFSRLTVAVRALTASFGGPLGIAAVAAVTAFTLYRSDAQAAEEQTLELNNQLRDLIGNIELMSEQQARFKLEGVKTQIAEVQKQIADAESEVARKRNTPSFGGKSDFAPLIFRDESAGAQAVLNERIQSLKTLQQAQDVLNDRLENYVVVQGKATKATADDNDELSKKGQNYLEELDFMRLKLDLMTEGYDLDQLDIVAKMMQAGLNRDQIGDYLQLAGALKSYTDAQKDAEKAAEKLRKEQEKAKESLDKFLEADSLKSLGSVLRDAFNEAGGAVGDLIGRLDDLGAIQEKNAKAIEDNNTAYANDAQKRGQMEVKIARKTAQANASTYAGMASAAKGFFAENSKGYKALQAVEQAFRAAELAMALESALTRVTLETGVAAAKVEGDAVQVSSGAVASAAIVGQKMTEGAASAVAGVANQASGDPYSAFARMAIMAAIMAALGFATGGFSSKGSAAPAPKGGLGQGKGTVLGDPEATSASLKNSIENLTSVESAGLEISRSMLVTLRSIDSAIRGVSLALIQRYYALTGSATPFAESKTEQARFNQDQMDAMQLANSSLNSVMTGGLSTSLQAGVLAGDKLFGTDFTGMFRNFGDSIIKAVFGGTSREQMSSGISVSLGQSLGDVLKNGINGAFYATIRETKDAEFGRTVYDRYYDIFKKLDADTARNLTQIIGGLFDATIQAATMLGADQTQAEAILKKLKLDIGKIQLSGLSAEDIQKRLEAVFSALGDSMAGALKGLLSDSEGSIADFQEAGEGLFQTLLRVATQTVAVSRVLLDMGQSIESLGFLEKARVSENLIELAGGVDAFGQNIGSFIDAFYDDSEKLVMVQGRLSRAFGELGLALPTTREEFRQLVLGLDLSTDSGQQLFTILTSLSQPLDEMFTLQEEVAAGADDAADALRDLRDLLLSIRESITQLEGGDTTIGRFNEALLALLAAADAETRIDAGENLHQAIMDRYSAEQDAIESARDTEIKALQEQRKVAEDGLKTWEEAQRIVKGITDYLTDLARTALAPGTPLERMQLGLDQFRGQVGLALAGDATAAGGVQKLAADVLNSVRDVFGSGGDYFTIYQEITGSLEMVADALGATPGASAQATLDTIDAQIADAGERADALLEQLRLDTITQLTTLGEYLQYGNSRLDAMLTALTGGLVPAPMPTFAGGGIATTPSIFGDAGPEAAVPLPDGRTIPVDLRGDVSGSRAVVDELRKVREQLAEMDQPVNFTFEMPDGTTKVVALTLKQIREKSLRGEKVIYSQGVQ